MRVRRRVNVMKSSTAKRSRTLARKNVRLLAEALEPRTMLSANSLVATPDLTFLTATAFHTYSPAQIRQAYGFNSLSLTGAGQTIAIVDAYDDPTIAADLHKFDQQFGLKDPTLSVYKETKSGKGPAVNSGWDMEIALDVEWAHAIAPGANILLVEANTSSLSDLLTAVDYARRAAGVSVVSMSWGSSEFAAEGMYDSYFTTPAGHAGVTFVASSGDGGAPASWPSISTNVVAVGGTTLTINANGSYGGEKAWSGSGGGYSPFESEPTFQRGFQNTGRRSNPDVSYDADPSSGFYVCENGGWYAVGGTSAGAPQWAGLFALANQGRAAVGRAPLTNTLQALYSLSSADFHDVTTGSNGYSAGAGYDAATGRGTPIANLVVADLINYGVTTTSTAAHTTTGVTVTGTAGKSALDGGSESLFGEWNSMTTVASGSGASSTVGASFTSFATTGAAPLTGSLVAVVPTTSTSTGNIGAGMTGNASQVDDLIDADPLSPSIAAQGPATDAQSADDLAKLMAAATANRGDQPTANSDTAQADAAAAAQANDSSAAEQLIDASADAQTPWRQAIDAIMAESRKWRAEAHAVQTAAATADGAMPVSALGARAAATASTEIAA